jgi:hypothetical protein
MTPSSAGTTTAKAIGHDQLLQVLRTVFCPDEAAEVRREMAPLEEKSVADLLALSCRQEIGPLVARALMTRDSLPADSKRAARASYERNLARNLFLRAETLAWIERLERAGIPCQVLKGVLWSLLLYGDLGARASADIDLLVHPEHGDTAIRLAARWGFHPVRPGPAPLDPDLNAIHLERLDGEVRYALDLHWGVELPRLVPVDHAAFWTGARAADNMPLDLVGLVLCLHLWRHAVTLKTLVDFTAYVHRFDAYIPEVRRRLAEAQVGDGLDLALILAQRVLGVRSRFTPEHHSKEMVLPWLERCLRLPFVERGRYFKWLVFPLQFDGLALPVRRYASHLVRPGARDGRLHLGSRIRRLTRVAARAAFSGGRLSARSHDGR